MHQITQLPLRTEVITKYLTIICRFVECITEGDTTHDPHEFTFVLNQILRALHQNMMMLRSLKKLVDSLSRETSAVKTLPSEVKELPPACLTAHHNLQLIQMTAATDFSALSSLYKW